MKSFHLQSHLNEIHATFPEAKHRPVIGITANYANEDACLRDRYYKQVVDAGGTPFIIPPVADKHVIINTLEHIDALLLTGGGDYNPLWCNEEPSPRLHAVNATRDLPELLITRLAFNRQIPMLGICRGIQTLAIALDGHVAQDISGNNEGNGKPSIKHRANAFTSTRSTIKLLMTRENDFGPQQRLPTALSKPSRVVSSSPSWVSNGILNGLRKKG